MNLGEVIFGLAALACFIVPVIYIQRRNSQEKKKFLAYFLDLAAKQQLAISAHDYWNHSYAIGIDPAKAKLLYLKKNDGGDQKVVIDLSEIESCVLVNQNRQVNDSVVIDCLALRFTPRNGKQAVKTLEFYNKEESMAVNEEFQLVSKWAGLINAHLQKMQENKEEAKPAGSPKLAA